MQQAIAELRLDRIHVDRIRQRQATFEAAKLPLVIGELAVLRDLPFVRDDKLPILHRDVHRVLSDARQFDFDVELPLLFPSGEISLPPSGGKRQINAVEETVEHAVHFLERRLLPLRQSECGLRR